MLAWQLLREMTVHILAEEAVLYPVVAEQVTVVVAGGSGSSSRSIPSREVPLHTCKQSCVHACTWAHHCVLGCPVVAAWQQLC